MLSPLSSTHIDSAPRHARARSLTVPYTPLLKHMFNVIVVGTPETGVHEFLAACASCADRVRVHIASAGSADQAIQAHKVNTQPACLTRSLCTLRNELTNFLPRIRMPLNALGTVMAFLPATPSLLQSS